MAPCDPAGYQRGHRLVAPVVRMSGFREDTSPAAQSRRGKLNKGKTPWRCGPICFTKKSRERFDSHHVKLDLRKPKP